MQWYSHFMSFHHEVLLEPGPSALLMLVKLVPQMNNGNLQQVSLCSGCNGAKMVQHGNRVPNQCHSRMLHAPDF